MERKILSNLKTWLYSSERKPLILRGARQVGKTWVVRELAKTEEYDLIEINFERNPEYADWFESNSPTTILELIELNMNKDIQPEKTILFLDEIQAASAVLPKLRWFREEMQSLAVVAAGSLLEFTLENHEFSMPVGRVSYMYMRPMSFVEFLWALDEKKLADYMITARESLEMHESIHKKLLEKFREYTLIGGMPECVNSWAAEHNYSVIAEIQGDLLQSYRDDFNKYKDRLSPEVMRMTMNSAVKQIGCKFVYSEVDTTDSSVNVKKSLNSLALARLLYKTYHTAGNGLPLGADMNEKFFKCIFIDSGLAMNMLGFKCYTEKEFMETVWTNKGAMAEQLVGQLLLTREVPHDAFVYYWQQIGSGSGNGEIDYLIAKDGEVLPIEVKSGASGSMKSLHIFMESKGLSQAVRFDTNMPSLMNVDIKTSQGKPVKYKLLSLPLYMAELL
ncbi:MAG: ATP-binding protein [Erysipelotrichaceae bacterium]|nr:ATP-binding protein [Erysipelotrichaceae bacterium]